MNALAIAFVLVACHLLACLLLPGAALLTWLDSIRSRLDSLGEKATVALALGATWATVQLALLLELRRRAPELPDSALLGLKYGSDLALVLAGAVRRHRSRTSARAPRATDRSAPWCRAELVVGLLVALGFGAYALLQFPFAADNAALYWLAGALSDPSRSLSTSQGSPAYVAWLFWPALLTWPTIAPGTIAAAAKIPLHLLALFTAHRLCGVWAPTTRTWAPLALYLLTLGTFLGDYGLFNTGKETVFGILFLFAAMATLARRAVGRGLEAGAALVALAFGFGAIALPYGAVFLVLLALCGRRGQPWAAFLARTLTLSGVALIVTIVALTPVSPLAAAAVVTAAWWLVRRAAARRSRVDRARPRSLARQTAIEALVFVAAVVAVAALLPVRFASVDRPPLDGTTRFADLFVFASHHFAAPYLGALALAGMALFVVRRGPQDHRPGSAALASFPFAVLIVPLAIAHLPGPPLPFHPQHVWDLAKDVPNWCWGLLANFFALGLVVAAFDLVTARPLGRWSPAARRRVTGVALGGLLALHFAVASRDGRFALLLRFHQGAWWSSTGGHRSPTLAILGEAYLREIGRAAPGAAPVLFVDATLPDAGIFSELAGFGARILTAEHRALDTALAERSDERPVLLLAGEDRLADWVGAAAVPAAVRLASIPGRESLFRLGSASKVAAESTALSPFEPPTPSLLANLVGAPLYVSGSALGARAGTSSTSLADGGTTIWIEVPCPNPGDRSLRLRVAFERGSERALLVSSRALGAPQLLSPDAPALAGTIELDRSGATASHYGRRWIALTLTGASSGGAEPGSRVAEARLLELEAFGHRLIDAQN